MADNSTLDAAVGLITAMLVKPWRDMNEEQRKNCRELIQLARAKAEAAEGGRFYNTARTYRAFANALEKEIAKGEAEQ